VSAKPGTTKYPKEAMLVLSLEKGGRNFFGCFSVLLFVTLYELLSNVIRSNRTPAKCIVELPG